MARLVAGFTGRAAGTCAGVQLYKARRGSGRVTAVRAAPEITAPRSPAQIMYQQRMSEIRRFPTTVAPFWLPYYQKGNTNPRGWFADLFELFAPQITPGAAFTTFKNTGFQHSRYGAITPCTFRCYRVSTTSFRIEWTTSPLLGNQAANDYLSFLIVDSAYPWDRATNRYRYGNGTTRRYNGNLLISSYYTNAKPAMVLWFDRTVATVYQREPAQLMTLSN